MRLLDSNIVIYATRQEHEWLRLDILSQPFAVSQATRTPERKRAINFKKRLMRSAGLRMLRA